MTDTSYTVSNGYIELPVTVDPTTLQQDAIAAIAAALPGWIPREGHIEELLLEQFAAMCAESAVVAGQVPLAIFGYFGTLIGIPPIAGAYAQANTTWVMTNSAGYTIPAGTLVAYNILGNQTAQFQTTETFTIPAGQTTATEIPIQALAFGSANNGYSPQALSTVTAYNFVSSVTSTSISAGGADAETTTAYINRLSYELQTITPRPILPGDFAILAEQVAGVYRAAAFNLVDPFNNILSANDSTFERSGSGSWTIVSGITSLIGSTGLVIAPSGSGNAVLKSGVYNVPENTPIEMNVVFSEAATSASITIELLYTDPNGESLGSTTSTAFQDSTAASPLTSGTVTGTTPTNCTGVSLQINIISPGANNHTLQAVSLSYVPTLSPSINAVSDAYFQIAFEQYPDATFEPGGLTWWPSDGDAVFWTPLLFETGIYAWEFSGGGSGGEGTLLSNFFYLAAGAYTLSSYIDVISVGSGDEPTFKIYKGNGTLIETITPVTGRAQTYIAQFTVGSAGMYYVEYDSGVTGTFGDTYVIVAIPAVYPQQFAEITNVLVATDVATITTQTAHNLGVGDIVTIAGLTNTVLNGTWTVTAVTLLTFKFSVSTGNIASTPDSGTVTVPTPNPGAGQTWTPAAEIQNQERQVTISAVDVNGNALSVSLYTELQAYLESLREINFVVNVIAPSYNPIDVSWSGYSLAGYSPAAVVAAQTAELQTYLSPATWAGGADTPPQWDGTQTAIRYLQIVGLLAETPGVDYLESVTIGYHTQASLGTVDLPMSGFAPLPEVGTLSGSLTTI